MEFSGALRRPLPITTASQPGSAWRSTPRFALDVAYRHSKAEARSVSNQTEAFFAEG